MELKSGELEAARKETAEVMATAERYKERVQLLEAAMKAAVDTDNDEAVALATETDSAAAKTTGGGSAATTVSGSSVDDILAQIRRDKLVDVTLPEELQSAVVCMQGMCGRALEKLSRDLYNDSSHFFEELLQVGFERVSIKCHKLTPLRFLVQNADDCSYADGVTPSLWLKVTEEAVTLLNNERGFSERDVRALCTIGQSTKEKDKGTIGKKGIGFKSVFMVTDAPHVLSGKWTFKLDVSSRGPVGMVCPEFVNPEGIATLLPEAAQKALQERHKSPVTCLYMPLKKRASLAVAGRMVRESLLFLRKVDTATAHP